jgi:chromosome segregation ATPase
MEGENSVQAGLDEAALEAEKSVSPTGETEQTSTPEQVASTDTKAKSQTVPYERFQEVNSKYRELEEKYASKDEEIAGQARALEKLTRDLETKERDATLVDQIRNLYQTGDDKWKQTLESLEKKLQGVEDEVDEGDKSPEEAAKETRRILKKETESLSDQLADQRVELIARQADSLASEYLENLPEEYTEVDRVRIAHLLNNAVNWEAIEAAQDWDAALTEEIPRALEHVVNNVYQEPTGKVVQTALEEARQRAEAETNRPDTVTELREKSNSLLNKDWGKVNVTKDSLGGVKDINPELSDAEFAKAMADSIRVNRALEEAELEASKKVS